MNLKYYRGDFTKFIPTTINSQDSKCNFVQIEILQKTRFTMRHFVIYDQHEIFVYMFKYFVHENTNYFLQTNRLVIKRI